MSWLKDEGDEVSAGDVLMVVESDKADMDVEAFEDGYLAKILVQEGEVADVGATVGLMVEDEADIDGAAPSAKAEAPAAAEEAAPAAAAAPDVSYSQIDMPALSSTMKEGKVVSWLKAEGDPISAGEAIMVVESDKADMDVEAFEDGYLAAIITEEGASGLVGAPVALIAEEEGDIPVLKAYAATLSGAPAAAAPPAAAEPASSPKATAAPVKTAAPKSTGDRVVASPLAKKLADEKGIDLSTVTGTGPNGRITADDVKSFSGAPAGPSPPSSKPEKPAHVPLPGVIPATPTARALAKKAKLDISQLAGTGSFGRVTERDVRIATGELKEERKKTSQTEQSSVEMPSGVEMFDGMKRAVSKNMEATLDTPVFRCTRDIGMDGFDEFYQKMKPKGVSVSSLLAKAVAMAVEKHPIINSAYHPEGGTVYKEDVNVAMAVAIDGGLITPTLKYANEKDIFELGQNWRELVEKAKSNSLTPDEYTTGTITISNLGMFGVNQFDAILPKGTGSILAIGSTREVVVPDKQSVLGLKIVKKMSITLTCDHRQIYGADGALFLKTLAEIMEDPLKTLL